MHTDKTGAIELVASLSRHTCPYCAARNELLIDDHGGTTVTHMDKGCFLRYCGCPHVAKTDLEIEPVGPAAPYGLVHVMVFTENGEMPEDAKERGDPSAPLQDQPGA